MKKKFLLCGRPETSKKILTRTAIANLTKAPLGVWGLRFVLLIISLLAIPLPSYSQAGDEVFSIGAYGGPNTTWIKFTGDYGIPKNAISYSPGNGYDYSLVARRKFKEGLHVSTGLSYQMQSYNIYFYNGGTVQATKESLNNYYLSIPLMAGYAITAKKWEFFAGLGIEFYYNYENDLSVFDLLYGKNEIQNTFFNGRQNFNPRFIDDMWGRWSFIGAFGLFNAGVGYQFSRRFSVACMPLIRFTDPFAQNLSEALPEIYVRGLGSFSLNLGLNYNFTVSDRGASSQGNEVKEKNIALGFSLIPDYMTNKIDNSPFTAPGENAHFAFSYAFTAEFGLSELVKLETGISIDNFNYLNLNNVFLGLPVVVKYYLPLGEARKSPFYVAAGCHIDYPTNIGWEYIPAHPFILPVALFKFGYHLKFGENYFFDIALGFEHQFPYIQTSNEADIMANSGYSIVGLPDFLFSTIGLGYKF